MKVVINILKFIIMLILVVCILFLGIKNIAFSTILNKDYVLNKFDETNLTVEVYNNIGFNGKYTLTEIDQIEI